MIHTVKGFSIVNEAEVDVFLELTCFFDDPVDVGDLISGSSTFSKKEYSWISSNEVDETGAYYTEWSKPERKTPVQYTNRYIWNLERW